MAQGFDCFCGSASCKGYISGAKNMSATSLQGMFLNKHIREMLIERDGLEVAEGVVVGFKDESPSIPNNGVKNGHSNGNGIKHNGNNGAEKKASHAQDETLAVLQLSLMQARKLVDSTQKALDTYKSLHCNGEHDEASSNGQKGAVRENGVGSRELSGEMGGDTL
jgi:hypothetical protein